MCWRFFMIHMFVAWFPHYGLFKFWHHLENFEFSRTYCDSVMICFDFITWFCNLLLQKVRQNSKIQNNDGSWTIIFSGTRLEISVHAPRSIFFLHMKKQEMAAEKWRNEKSPLMNTCCVLFIHEPIKEKKVFLGSLLTS